MLSQLQLVLDTFLLLTFVWLGFRIFRSRARSPPGPSGAPVVGHTWQIPADRQWLTFDSWIRQYGERLLFVIVVVHADI